jgi:hypothetical protein
MCLRERPTHHQSLVEGEETSKPLLYNGLSTTAGKKFNSELAHAVTLLALLSRTPPSISITMIPFENSGFRVYRHS